MLAGGRDLFRYVQHLFLIINMGRSQRGEADDGVHGGANIVAHIEQELPLGTVCRTLVLECDLQFAVLFLQLSLILLLLLFFCCSISCTERLRSTRRTITSRM